MINITTEKQLEEVVNYLKENWFWYFYSYSLNKEKVDHIIDKANTLNINNFDKEGLKKKFTWSYVEFENTCKDFFSNFWKSDKLDELLYKRLPTMKSKDWSKYWIKRLWKVNNKQIIFNAYYDYYTINLLMLLLWYTGSIDYISEYNKKELTWTFIDTFWNAIQYKTFLNWNIKLSGNVAEINNKIKSLLEKKNQENITKWYDTKNNRIIE